MHCIPEEQRKLHVTTEAIAVFAVAPFMFYLTAQRKLPVWARAVSFGVGVGTLLVDGSLLLRNLQRQG